MNKGFEPIENLDNSVKIDWFFKINSQLIWKCILQMNNVWFKKYFDNIDIVIVTLIWSFFCKYFCISYCKFVMPRTFKMRNTKYPYNNSIQRYIFIKMLENIFLWISGNWQNWQKIKVAWHCHCQFIVIFWQFFIWYCKFLI